MDSTTPTLTEVLRLLQAIEGRLTRIENDRPTSTDNGPKTNNGGGATTARQDQQPSNMDNGGTPGTTADRNYAKAVQTPRPPHLMDLTAHGTDGGVQSGGRAPEHYNRRFVESSNRDFGELAFALYRTCQLKHHLGIWTQLPAKLRGNLDEFFNSISPPLPDEALKNDLYRLYHELTTNIKLVVTKHMTGKLDDTKRVITRCNPVDKEKAATKAKDLVRSRLNKIRLDRVDVWLDEALGWTGSCEFDRDNNTVPRTTQSNPAPVAATGATNIAATGANNPIQKDLITFATEGEPSNPSDSTDTDMEVVSRKRKKEASPQAPTNPITTNNRFDSLPIELIDDETTETDMTRTRVTPIHKKKNRASTPPTEPQDNISFNTSLIEDDTDRRDSIEELPIVTQTQPASTSHGPRPTRNPTLSSTQPNNPTIKQNTPTIHQSDPHLHPKADWTVKLRPGASTLVIADSNFRRMVNIPEDWDVHVYPGASWIWGYNILSKYNGIHPDKIVLALGINNKAQVTESWGHDLTRCFNVAKNITDKTYILGVSIAIKSKLSPNEVRNIESMNAMAKKFASRRFIPPLLLEEVRIDPQDPTGIHHSKETVEAIKISIQKFLN